MYFGIIFIVFNSIKYLFFYRLHLSFRWNTFPWLVNSHFLNNSDLMKHPVHINVIYIIYNTLIVLFYYPFFQVTMYQSHEIIITRGFCIVQAITHVDCDVEHRGYANYQWRTVSLFSKWRFALLYTKIQRSVFKCMKFIFWKEKENFDYWKCLLGCNFLLIFAIKTIALWIL